VNDDLYADLRGRTSYRGPAARRPPAHVVPAGFLYEADDAPVQWRSDGSAWVEATAELEPWRLEYAEDIAAGLHVRQERELGVPLASSSLIGLLGGRTPRVIEWVIVDAKRDYGELVSIRGVRPDGEQVAIYCHRGELVRVRSGP
jgi:hypothetical protein